MAATAMAPARTRAAARDTRGRGTLRAINAWSAAALAALAVSGASAQGLGPVTPPPGREETALAVSDAPDASARFVATPGAVKPGGDVDLMLLVRNGPRVQQINVAGGVIVRFAAAEADAIRWCAYLATVEQIVRGSKTCEPANPIKDKAEYRVP